MALRNLIVLLVLLAATSLGLAQGKIRFVTDSLHLVYWAPDIRQLDASDEQFAGQAYQLGQGAQTLTIELWAGTSSDLLTAVGTNSFAGQVDPGTFPGMGIVLPIGFPWGTPAFFQVLIYDSAASSFSAAYTTLGHYFGQTPIFQVTPGSTSYSSIVSHASPAFSTWADGSFNLDYLSLGSRGAIMLQLRNTCCTLEGEDLILTWSAPYILQCATNVLGPYSDVLGASSPFATNTFLHPQLFFRWRH
jgi:hypothetical protein